MTDKQFYAAYLEAGNYSDPDAFASDVALSDAFAPVTDDQLPGLLTELRQIWRYAHVTVQDVVRHTGLSQTDFAARFAIPLRTVQNWVTGVRVCPQYICMMLAELCGM